MHRSTDEWKVRDDIFHYASTGDLDKLLSALDQGEDVNTQVSIYLLVVADGLSVHLLLD